MEKITSTSIQEFLSDFLSNSNTELLEEGKEQNDILSVAEARGYNLKNRKALAGFKTIYTFADKANKNKARLPKEKLLKVLPEIIGTPIDVDHKREFVVGHYIDYRYIASEDKIVAYGVFYKSNFAEKWAEAQKLFKAGKLATSYEIWCPKNKRKYLPDGTYELTTMEVAGGALIFKETPAFSEALVLECAKINSEILEEDLVVASENKYNEEDLITSSTAVAEVPVRIPNDEKQTAKEKVDSSNFMTAKELIARGQEIKDKMASNPDFKKQVEENLNRPNPNLIPKIKCQNCQKEFDNSGLIAQSSDKKCPHCQAIVGELGEVKYPPQIPDFSVSCPDCSSRNFLIKKNNDKEAEVTCQNCKKDYKLTFKPNVTVPMSEQIALSISGSTSCPQCGKSVGYSGTTKALPRSLKCPNCELSFAIDVVKGTKNKKVMSIEDVADLNKASAEGEVNGMENKDNVQPDANLAPVEPVAVVEPVVSTPTAVVDDQVTSVIEPVSTVAEVVAEAVAVVESNVAIEPVVVSEELVVAEVVKPKMYTQEEMDKLQCQLDEAKAKTGKMKKLFKAACGKKRTLAKASVLHKASVDDLEVARVENTDLKAKIELLEANAVKIIERKNTLGEFGKNLSHKDILDDKEFEFAMVKKENAELKSHLNVASTHVAVAPTKRVDDLKKMRDEVDAGVSKINKG